MCDGRVRAGKNNFFDQRRLMSAFSQAAQDRGSSCLVNLHDAESMIASDVNDADFGPFTKEPVVSREGVATDTTFSIMNRYGGNVARNINILSRGADDRPPVEIELSWEKRREAALSVRRCVDEKLGLYLNVENPYHYMIIKVSQVITCYMLLTVVRPLQRHPKTSPPPIPGFRILELTSDMFENVGEMMYNPKLEFYRWYGHMYNKWHPIAVAAAELCVQTEGPAVERAWRSIDPVYQDAAKGIADSEKGMLWRPIEKLMRRARAIRAAKQAGANMATVLEQLGSHPKQESISPTSNKPVQQPPSEIFQAMDLTGQVKQEQQAQPFALPGGGISAPPMVNLQSMDAQRLADTGTSSCGAADWTQQLGNQWQFDMNLGAVNGTPAAGWANWESFVDDLNVNESALLDSGPSFFEGRNKFAGMQ